jgi:hypothetical protein
MKRAHLGIQAAIVLMMVAFVSWPQFRPVLRPVGAQSVWRYGPSDAQQALAADAARYSDTGVIRRTSVPVGRPRFTTDLPEPQVGSAQGAGNLGADATWYTPQAVAMLGGKLNALVGLARTSLNAPIPYARLLLRNIRTGQVMARTTANEQGQFSFLDLDSSQYIVELVGLDGSVVASSQMVALARGDVMQTEVRSAASAAAVRATLGNSLAPSMPQVTKVASDGDVTRTTPTLASAITPQ